jgi:hypothetical protein
MQHKRRESNVNEESQIKKVVLDNWVAGGSSGAKWAQTLLSGDDTNAGDLPLQRPFDDVWDAVSEGRPLGGDASGLGLLASLERRVQMQKERLQMWQEFHDGLRDPEDVHFQRAKESTSGAKFEFKGHQRLQLGRPAKEKKYVSSRADGNAYSAILDTLRVDIAGASKSRRQGGVGWTSKHEGGFEHRSHDLFSPVKGSAPSNPTQHITKPVKPLNIMEDRPSLLAPTKKPELNGFKIKRLGRNDSKTDTSLPPKKEPSPPPAPAPKVDERPTTPEMETPIKITQATPLRHAEEESPTAADLIISSVVNATPSPVKTKLMSLTERTRMSMALARDPGSVDSGIAMPPSITDDSDAEEDSTLPALPTKLGNEERNGNGNGNGNVQRRVSLLERTRLSLASLPPAPQPRKSLARKRESLFPVNQFETPGKPRVRSEVKGDATPEEKLFSEEAEYASVFKSRPRVALSPVPFTPSEVEDGGSESGYGNGNGTGAFDEDGGSDGEGDAGVRSSPLIGRRKMIAG